MGICDEVYMNNRRNNNNNNYNNNGNQENISPSAPKPTVLIDQSRLKEIATSELKKSFLEEHNEQRSNFRSRPLTEDPLLSVNASEFNKSIMSQHLGQNIQLGSPKYLNQECGYNVAFFARGESIDAKKLLEKWCNSQGGDSKDFMQVIWANTNKMGLSIIQDTVTQESSVLVAYYPKAKLMNENNQQNVSDQFKNAAQKLEVNY